MLICNSVMKLTFTVQKYYYKFCSVWSIVIITPHFKAYLWWFWPILEHQTPYFSTRTTGRWTACFGGTISYMPILLHCILLICSRQSSSLRTEYNILYFTHKNVQHNFAHMILQITEIKVKRIQSQLTSLNPRFFALFITHAARNALW